MVACALSAVLLLWVHYHAAVAAMPRAAVPEPGVPPPPAQGANVVFYIYPTPASADHPVIGDLDSLVPGGRLTVVFHGFKGSHDAKSMQSIREALLLNGVQNVVVVDWGPLADNRNESALTSYHHVRDHGVMTAATEAAQWLSHLLEHKQIRPEDVHLIGFSLGAHVVGIVGHMLNSTLGRITGLDPPSFGYERATLDQRLDMKDAQFVDVIHTSPGVLSFSEPIGHVDFFPNGDVMPQQGCPNDNPIHIVTCSHYFAFVLFAESVFNKKALMATECDSWGSFSRGECKGHPRAAMGYHTPPSTRGVFYSKTHRKVPFGDEDPQNPLPERMRELLTYDQSESIVNPTDVMNFLTRKDKSAGEHMAEDIVDDRHVMRMKSLRHHTTTQPPPAFVDSGALSHCGSVLLLLLSVHLARLV